MLRSAWFGLLLGVTGCFADPPVVGETTAASSSNGATSDGQSSGSSDASGTTEPGMTSAVMTSSADVTGSMEVTSVEPPTTGAPPTSGSVSIGDTTSPPSDTGSAGPCTCGFDPSSMRVMEGAYECVPTSGGLEPDPTTVPCPKKFGPTSPCMAYPVTLVGCCDPSGNVLWCPDSEAGTVPEVIDCAMECGGG